MTARALIPIDVMEAKETEYRLELAKERMRVLRYRDLLEEHGIEPPDLDDEQLVQMLRDARAVITTASEFVAHLGTAKELIR